MTKERKPLDFILKLFINIICITYFFITMDEVIYEYHKQRNEKFSMFITKPIYFLYETIRS